jgi:regulator of sigma E protease
MMNDLPISPGMILDLMLFLFGFGFIVFIHELGHFLAARWAGIRVLAFAIGFGPAICSYRRGMGFRQGSSEADYRRLLESLPESGETPARAVSSTEYRFNWLPFGGYVKMLGQDDVRPEAVSSAADSYQSVKPWKRMVVISAGVVMNIILAATLFVIVFMAGLKTEPPIVGRVAPGTPASRAVAANAATTGVTEKGLQPGDLVLTVNGKHAREFSDVVLETTMAERGQAVSIMLSRRGVDQPLEFSLVPETSPLSGLLEVGVEPARSATLLRGRTDAERAELAKALQRSGLIGVKPGMTLIGTSDGRTIESFAEADRLIRESDGKPLTLAFATRDPSGHVLEKVEVQVSPVPSMQVGFVRTSRGVTPTGHLLGLLPVMKVESTDGPLYKRGFDQGLRTGDVFARVGVLEYPSLPAGMSEIRAHRGKRLALTVLRSAETGPPVLVDMIADVSAEGTIGFQAGDTRDESSVVALPVSPMLLPPTGTGTTETKNWPTTVPPAASVVTTPGLRIDMVDGHPVANFSEIRQHLKDATRRAFTDGLTSATLTLAVSMPGKPEQDSIDPSRRLEWVLSRDAMVSLHELGWDNPLPAELFEPEQFVLVATGPLDAVNIGLAKTHAVMINTYLTFVRLFQQTVKIEHLKGPVGIAHLGTLIAGRGLVWMLFFLALISVNLAVVNFLPLPIVDGGQFLLLVYEQLRGKPASIGFQNAITMAGFALIGSLFLLVTFNDVKNLLGL